MGGGGLHPHTLVATSLHPVASYDRCSYSDTVSDAASAIDAARCSLRSKQVKQHQEAIKCEQYVIHANSECREITLEMSDVLN